MSTTAPRVAAPRAALPRPAPALLPRGAGRLLGFLLLGGYGVLRWGQLVQPAGRERLVLALGLGLGAGLALERLRRVRRRIAAPASVVFALVVAVAALLLAGAPLRALSPRHLDRLGHGLGTGLDALPAVQPPLQAGAGWTRTVIVLGGVLLLVLGATFALAVRRRAPAAALLLAVAAVPAVVLPSRAPVLHGALLAGALASFLWLDRVRRGDAAAAALTAALALGAGILGASLLDRDGPLLDPASVSVALRGSGGVVFDWNQRYGPLDWPREGREVLNVRARFPTYWKAQNLERFDGMGWRSDATRAEARTSDPSVASNPRWRQTVRVTIRDMRTQDLIGAGTTVGIAAAPQQPLAGLTPGTWRVDRGLVRGDSYLAEVYAPHPSARELAEAGYAYPGSLAPARTLALPRPRGERPASVTFAPFVPAAAAPTAPSTRVLDAAGEALVRRGPYARAYALARRLATVSVSADDYRRRIQRFLARGFRYSELAPRRAVPLESFLFHDRRGSCQMFSGAMALLLRMGGVPARVAAGFTPGDFDRGGGDLVVTDSDAHSWVEAWFPSIGWVAFDPTPPLAPARGGAGVDPGTARASPRSHLGLTRGDVPVATRGGGREDGNADGASGALLAGLGASALLAIGTGIAIVRSRRRRRAGSRSAPSATDRAVDELERALHRTGRRLPATITLRELEQRYARSPEILDYVRTLRVARYGGAGGGAPSARQRRDLRRGLAAGLGLAGHVRALRGLPPRWPGRPAT